MPLYELMFILNPSQEKEAIKKIIERITSLISKAKGKIEKVDEWGKRKLAYPIEKHGEGYYVVINFKLEPKKVSDINRALRLSSDILRHIIVRTDVKEGA